MTVHDDDAAGTGSIAHSICARTEWHAPARARCGRSRSLRPISLHTRGDCLRRTAGSGVAVQRPDASQPLPQLHGREECRGDAEGIWGDGAGTGTRAVREERCARRQEIAQATVVAQNGLIKVWWQGVVAAMTAGPPTAWRGSDDPMTG